jgi:hypothetical protein
MSRTLNDWGSLVLAELDHREEPGTVARLIAEAPGKAVTVAEDDVVAALLKLADKLGGPGKGGAATQGANGGIGCSQERTGCVS